MFEEIAFSRLDKFVVVSTWRSPLSICSRTAPLCGDCAIEWVAVSAPFSLPGLMDQVGICPPRICPPRSVHPGSVHPGSVHPGSVHPGSVHPGSVHPGSAHPGSVHPGSAHPDLSTPDLSTPDLSVHPDLSTPALPTPALFTAVSGRAPMPSFTTAPIELARARWRRWQRDQRHRRDGRMCGACDW